MSKEEEINPILMWCMVIFLVIGMITSLYFGAIYGYKGVKYLIDKSKVEHIEIINTTNIIECSLNNTNYKLIEFNNEVPYFKCFVIDTLIKEFYDNKYVNIDINNPDEWYGKEDYCAHPDGNVCYGYSTREILPQINIQENGVFSFENELLLRNNNDWKCYGTANYIFKHKKIEQYLCYNNTKEIFNNGNTNVTNSLFVNETIINTITDDSNKWEKTFEYRLIKGV